MRKFIVIFLFTLSLCAILAGCEFSQKNDIWPGTNDIIYKCENVDSAISNNM